METPAATEVTTSVPNSAKHPQSGRLPTRLETVIADVLSQLLEGKRLTGMDGVYAASTTRLAAVVHDLEQTHAWTVERDEIANGCNDGRTTTITRYWLDSGAIKTARNAGADDWCAQVKAARAALRRKAMEAKREAYRKNQRKAMRTIPPGQGELFTVGGAHGQ
ncbi:MAG: hypothetical protein MUF44_01440 [Hydrogenophaga sp.]|jgi:hypothetical protein|nr:hypothetical protein [Hydrogenophaga sp.]